MRLINSAVAFIILILGIACEPSEQSQSSTEVNQQSLFELLNPETTGIDFQNTVVDGEHFNIITYRNFYNGGGVAIGDINNDSLPDLYFTSNQNANKLYLNQGNFSFLDITEKAGVGGTKAWSTGVTMTDVNADGLLDIYVCNSGDLEGTDKENELFINNGDLTFTERAAEFKLNNSGYSTHAAFFDYDLDGDLDCYILNNSFRDPSKIELYRKVREERIDPGGDKLMRNDQGVFSDVTEEAGIFSSDIGFGLGISVGDLNGDNMPDIYISNDFWERDYLYINLGNGRFSEELINRINSCSLSSMGADMADINNDGAMEIFTTDMLPADNYRLHTTFTFEAYHLEDLKYRSNFHYQMAQNCLHLNDGEADFQEIAFLSGTAATDWSWGALIFDFENDGHKDIFVSNGIARDLMSNDYRDFAEDYQVENIKDENSDLPLREAVSPMLISHMPLQAISNYGYLGNGGITFIDKADSLGLGQPSFSNGSAYGDLDNDGDLDLVVNNVNQPGFVYRNNTVTGSNHHFLKVKFKGTENNLFGIGAKVIISTAGKTFIHENYNNRGFQSSIEPLVLFGLGNIQNLEVLKVLWPDGKTEVLSDLQVDQTITLDHANATEPINEIEKVNPPALFRQTSFLSSAVHQENRYNDFDREILLTQMLSTEGPRLITGDVNDDKLDDFILLGASGDPDKLFVQKPDGKFSLVKNSGLSGDLNFESTCGALFDQDNDGDLDLMIGSGGNEIEKDRQFFEIRLYKNNGNGRFTRDLDGLPKMIGNFSTLEVSDFDQDGAIDVFLGARSVPGNYGLPPRNFLLRNVNGTFIDKAPEALGNIGMVTDASWTDIDADGDPDLILVGDWMPVSIFLNEEGKIRDVTTVANSSGWWSRVEPSDLDGDGDLDFVLGNWGLNSKFRASPDKALTMYVNDFDDNGKSEFIINWYPPGETTIYPFAHKMDLTSQLPGLRKNILKYEDYARKNYDSLFSADTRERSIEYKVDYLENAILWNNGNNRFELSALPLEAQVAPVYGIIAGDLDGDEHLDIWLGGNFYALKPQVGRIDASRGVFLKGGTDRSFSYVPPKKSGIYVHGEVRDAVTIKTANGEKVLIARNNDTVLQFEHRAR